MYLHSNPNPYGKMRNDCVVRAIAIVTGKSWVDVYLDLCLQGLLVGDWGNIDDVWGSYVRSIGFVRESIPNSCPDCYTVRDFARDHPKGTYILATGSHAVAVIDGCYIDAWDSGDESPSFLSFLKMNETLKQR